MQRPARGVHRRLGRQNRERLRLIEELDRTRGELAEVSREAGVLAERERLARDIHDTIAQGFASIVMLLQAAEADAGPNRHLELAVRTARENLAETRGLVAALAPPALDGGSLVEALRRMADDFDLPADLVVEGSRARWTRRRSSCCGWRRRRSPTSASTRAPGR
ncbi:sensor histidine kinase [Actinomadura madurae]|uniref:sensor histidine kinase n=1 Tax=Actinomadura madurae TaxID=1993 RepID=UPI0020D253D4|nr:histidine kinase [Actinomadura madurae]MCP9971452.1 histidine kinase [Actinomadura madurae]MCP9983943.1 histidine kinase [Actinomadura madurae]